MQTFKPFFSHTCYAYRHHWPLLFYTTFSDLDLGLGSQGQHKGKPVNFIFSHIFNCSGWNLILVLNTLMLLLSEILLESEVSPVLLCQKNFYSEMYSDMCLAQIWYNDRNCCYRTLHLDTSLSDLDLHSRSQGPERAENVPVISQFSIDLYQIWCTVETCWCHEPPMSMSFMTPIWSCMISIQGRETYLCDLLKMKKKKIQIGFLYSDIYRLIFFKLDMVTDTAKFSVIPGLHK